MSTSHNRTIIETSDLSVQFRMERGTSKVLDGIDMSVYDGEIIGVVGESGSGKSMFADSLLDAVVDPGEVTGDVTYYPEDGEEVDVLELSKDELMALRWNEISMVFQGAQSSFNPTIGIRAHFEETLKAHGRNVEEGMEHARDLISDLHMDPERVLDSYPHELSGGMKQRTLIALSLILDPNVLVMDEPTAALDLLMQRSILSLLDDIKDKYDITIIFITHDLPLVAGLADRLAVMYAFKFVEIGLANEIISSPSHPYTRALLKAVPNMDRPLSSMEPIEGSAPDPVNIPSGCSYHPRCPISTDECTSTDPGFERVSDTHEAACFHWERSMEEVPFQPPEEESVGLSADQPHDSYAVTEGDSIISVENTSVHFEQSSGGIIDSLLNEPKTVHAVDDIDLDIYDNDVVVLVGESGCGKTTLGKTIIGVQRPTDGSVKYRGQDIWDARDNVGDVQIPYSYIRRALQIIPQDPGSSLNPNRTVEASLSVPLKQWAPELSTQDRKARIHGMLDRVGMSPPEDYAGRYPHQLSGGEKQRIALIRALLMNPDVILADEAVSALDVSLRVEMMDLMLKLQEMFDTSYLFVSHNLSNARYLAGNADGRIAVMYLGEIVEIGPAESVIQNPQHPYTKVLNWSTANLETDPSIEEPPVRGIDIPDPVDPPSGCRFHTRCPEARETCTKQKPDAVGASHSDDHRVSCFRNYPEDHPYWSDQELAADESESAESSKREVSVE
ncbi:ABC transporter ATP-binding protein [Halobacteria archaeon AArc-m2/3/4]|uniref:Nickel import system ATP-binding protein NikD n=1 Tax=Natronoglomus mannanivorans TaxID=2979990 RepID=A0ABT2QGQ4_9EURY|nr:ABC transporter ATP-binding protein [Halobacteria archaeon AArc-m2/3/4]